MTCLAKLFEKPNLVIPFMLGSCKPAEFLLKFYFTRLLRFDKLHWNNLFFNLITSKILYIGFLFDIHTINYTNRRAGFRMRYSDLKKINRDTVKYWQVFKRKGGKLFIIWWKPLFNQSVAVFRRTTLPHRFKRKSLESVYIK